MNIDQIAMCYISMDSSQRAIQTNVFFFQISNQSLKFWPITENYSNE